MTEMIPAWVYVYSDRTTGRLTLDVYPKDKYPNGTAPAGRVWGEDKVRKEPLVNPTTIDDWMDEAGTEDKGFETRLIEAWDVEDITELLEIMKEEE